MTPERWQEIQDVLEKALELAPEKRSIFLDRACLSDQSLRREVETLLASSDGVRSSFLQSSTPRVTLAPGTKLGDYEVKSLLGAGGMGEVYRARDSRLGRDVAIKILPATLSADSDRLRRFEQEARAAAALNHPNILAVFQMGTHESAAYLVSELLEGETLRTQLKRGRLPVRKAIDYGVQIARGLAAAQEKGIVHRDLKPENLFVTKDGRVKILDFGLAKLTQPGSALDALAHTGKTEEGVVMGTVGYMSPEQVRGQTADHRTDIFSFGVILYEMLTGKRAFQKPTSPETMTAILNDDPPSISQVAANIPPAMQRVVHRCLEKNPEQRFQSASDLAFALDALSESSDGSSKSAVGGHRVGEDTPSPRSLIARYKWTLPAVAAILIAMALALRPASRLWKRSPTARAHLVQRQLTASMTDNPITTAVISRDGKYLAYSDKDGIAIQEIENGDTHRLPGTVGLKAQDWYPDGLHLLVIDAQDSLWTLFAFSGEKRKLAEHIFHAVLSPDGSQILVFREGTPSEIWTMSAEGNNLERRITSENKDRFTDACWSPDGKAIADVRSTSTFAGTLEIRTLQTNDIRKLLTEPLLGIGGGGAVRWLPGGRILFARIKNGREDSDLWALSLDAKGQSSGEPVRLTDTTFSSVAALSASADGKRVVPLILREQFPVFLANLNVTAHKLEQPVHLTNDAWHNMPRAWTPDSQTLFYFSRGDADRIYKRRITSDSPKLFVNRADDYSMTSRNSVSPDGSWLFVMLDAKAGGPKLVRLPLSGGPPQTVLTMAGPGSVQCVLSASICVLSEQIGAQKVFSIVDSTRGRLKELARVEAILSTDTSVSPDGTKITLVGNGSDVVRLLDLQTKQIREIHPIPPQQFLQQAVWSADGKRLFVSGFPDEKGRLLEMDEGGHTHLLLENPNGWIGNIAPSPDGRRIAYSYFTAEANATLLENF